MPPNLKWRKLRWMADCTKHNLSSYFLLTTIWTDLAMRGHWGKNNHFYCYCLFTCPADTQLHYHSLGICLCPPDKYSLSFQGWMDYKNTYMRTRDIRNRKWHFLKPVLKLHCFTFVCFLSLVAADISTMFTSLSLVMSCLLFGAGQVVYSESIRAFSLETSLSCC